MASSDFNIHESWKLLWSGSASTGTLIPIANPDKYKELQIVGYEGTNSTGKRWVVNLSTVGLSLGTVYNIPQATLYGLFKWDSTGITISATDTVVTYVYGIM